MEIMENFMIYVLEIVEVEGLNHVWFEEYPTSSRFYTLHSSLKIPLHSAFSVIETLGVDFCHI